jgi:4-hydroxy-tetrahydrodipicolinate reductase
MVLPMISVAVLGASGRMGSLAIELIDADANLKLHAAIGSDASHERMLGADVVLDFTRPDVSPQLVSFAIQNNLKVVVGTSGWSEAKLHSLSSDLEGHPEAAVLVVPNFSIGSMLAQSFAAQAAKFFGSVEIIETHHTHKVDSPSGTAIRTAELISKSREHQPLIPGVGQPARGEVVAGVPIHSLRVQGVSAKQEVIFGGSDEVLVLSHDVSSHRAYAQGILLAINYVQQSKGLTIGLDAVIGR